MKSSNTLTPFGKLVVKALVDQDMTKTELAGQIGTSPQHLSRILHGTRPGGKAHPGDRRRPRPRPPEGGEGDGRITAEGRDGSAGRIYHAGGGRSL